MRDRESTGDAIRVLIVDDQLMIRLGLRAILEASNGVTVIDDVEDGFRALKTISEHPIDVVLMDIRMPGIDGVETTKRIRAIESGRQPKILVLTTFDNDKNVLSALRAGANGFLSKGVGPTELLNGIREVATGQGVLSGVAAAAVIGQVTETNVTTVDEAIAERFVHLTARERDVVMYAARGMDNREIAEHLLVSPFTVKTHISRAMVKAGARDRAQLVAFVHLAGMGS